MQHPSRYKINTSSFAHYWQKGIGVELLAKLPQKPQIENADQFAPLLYQYDQRTDEVVKKVYQKIGFVKGHQALKDHLNGIKNEDEEIQKIFDDYFAEIDFNPDWVDFDLINIGASLSKRAGVNALIVLRDYCLMGGYESSAINKPLIYTGALKKGAVKRLAETVDFWVNINGEDALQKGKQGFKDVFITRFLHSFSRVNILEKTDWDNNKWGAPLNYWDMLATHLGFSLVFVVGLRKLGMKIRDAEILGIFHQWKYISYLLGTPIELLPDTEKEAIESFYYWSMTQADGDEDSIALAKALYNEPLEAKYPSSLLQRKFIRLVNIYYCHYLLGEFSCEQLQIPKTTIGKIGHLNILKNKSESKKIDNAEFRKKMSSRGQKAQEDIRDNYLKFNL